MSFSSFLVASEGTGLEWSTKARQKWTAEDFKFWLMFYKSDAREEWDQIAWEVNVCSSLRDLPKEVNFLRFATFDFARLLKIPMDEAEQLMSAFSTVDVENGGFGSGLSDCE
jgi:hypothetical protein